MCCDQNIHTSVKSNEPLAPNSILSGTPSTMNRYEKLELSDFYKKDILVNTLRESLLNIALPQPLNEKLSELITHWDAETNLKLNMQKLPNSGDYSPFGLCLESIDLTPNEKKSVQLELEKYIINKFPFLLAEFDRITDGEINKRLKEPNGCPADLTREQKKVINLCTNYFEDLRETQRNSMEMCTLMKEWIDLRLGVMVKRLENKAEICKYKHKLNEISGKILCVQIKRFVYDGKISTVKDYMQYYINMKTQLDDLKTQIRDYKKILEIDDEYA